jgi:predicted RecB family nuclease
MLRSSSGQLVLSATDLTNHLGCLHLTHERRRIALGLRGKPQAVSDPHAELVRERGQAHEDERLAHFVSVAGGRYADLSVHGGWTIQDIERGAAATEDAMRDGPPLIYQATFFDGRWQGRTDFLRRIEVPSRLGAYAYELLDTKLARQVKPHVVHQLCLYNRLLAAVQDFEPERAYVVLGNGEEMPVALHRYRALHRHTALRLERVVDGEPEPVYPEPVAHCGICQLDPECSARRRADDHLSLVAGATRDARAKLDAAHIATVAGLASAVADTDVADLPPERFDLLRNQAMLQVKSRAAHLPTRRQLPPARERGYARLPEPSQGDIFFDLEGDPYVGNDGIEYLWGWTTVDGTYHRRWAHTDAEEQAALCEFIEFVEAARAHDPHLHVFHYAAHEMSKLRSLAQKYGVLETTVDDWLRSHLLVDLFVVVRQALQVGEESYSLKALERHHAFERKERAVREGGGSIIAYENWLKTGDETLLESIRAYNQEDCLSTASLFAWLVQEMRPEAVLQYPAEFARLALPAHQETYEPPKWLAEILALVERLRNGLPTVAGDDDDEQAGRRLLAGLLLYHYRESKPQFWAWFDLKAKTAEELVGEPGAVGLPTLDRSVMPKVCVQSYDWTYRFPPQEVKKLSPGIVVDPTTGKKHTLVRIEDDYLVLRRGMKSDPPAPTALIGRAPPLGDPMRNAIAAVAESLLAGEDRYHVALAMLRREAPRLLSGALGPEIDQLISATLGLDRSVLPVQGPPGTGKTYRGARMIVAALKAGQRVAISAQSHAAIQNLLSMIESHAQETGYRFAGVYKGDGYESAHGLVASVKTDAETFRDDYALVAGTSWLLSCERHREQFGTLFIDEAGQFSLASAIAVAPCAQSVVLLGDPQQLPHVNQAFHVDGAGASVLEHLLDGHDVVQPGRGVLLVETWRMHPDVCAFVSERSYGGKLRSREACSLRGIDAPGPITGVGLRSLAVEHAARSQDSPEEAAAIAAACRTLLAGGRLTDENGVSRPLEPDDLMVVAPYNLAVARIRQAVPAGVRVGTVDMFQGQEAPVLFFAMTCSSGGDIPRGLDFLFSRNRLNVAISRAQCLAVLVHAPRLLDADCNTLEQMALVDGACRFAELATRVEPSRDRAVAA